MQKESLALIQLKKNIEDMRPSKKPFPERNWHYISNLGLNSRLNRSQTRLQPQSHNASPPFSGLRESLTHKELSDLRKQLELKDLQLKELHQKLGQRGSLTPVSGSALRKDNRYKYGAEKLFQVPAKPVQYALQSPQLPNKVYYTKQAPKPLSVDTITGLPRATGQSPFQKAGAAVAQGFQRPFFH